MASRVRALRAEGHDPLLAAPALYQGLATAVGVAFEPLDLDRFPRLRPAGQPADRTPGSTLRGLDRLPLRLD